MKHTTLDKQDGGTFLDAESCSSTVMWNVYLRESVGHKDPTDDYCIVSGTVRLTDCGKMVSWELGSDDSSVDKLDVAIHQLKLARLHLRRMQAMRKAWRKKRNLPVDGSSHYE